MKTIFIYCLKDPATGDVRYIGKTDNLKRRFSQHLRTKEKNRLGNWLRSLKEKEPILVLLHEVAEGESWQEEERRYISCARAVGVDLVNSTDGGEGVTMTPEIRKKIGDKNRRPRGPFSPKHRANMGAARSGRPLSPEHRAALSASLKGVPTGPRSPEHCAAISAARKGKPPSLAARLMNTARRGRPWSTARRAAFEQGKTKTS